MSLLYNIVLTVTLAVLCLRREESAQASAISYSVRINFFSVPMCFCSVSAPSNPFASPRCSTGALCQRLVSQVPVLLSAYTAFHSLIMLVLALCWYKPALYLPFRPLYKKGDLFQTIVIRHLTGDNQQLGKSSCNFLIQPYQQCNPYCPLVLSSLLLSL